MPYNTRFLPKKRKNTLNSIEGKTLATDLLKHFLFLLTVKPKYKCTMSHCEISSFSPWYLSTSLICLDAARQDPVIWTRMIKVPLSSLKWLPVNNVPAFISFVNVQHCLQNLLFCPQIINCTCNLSPCVLYHVRFRCQYLHRIYCTMSFFCYFLSCLKIFLIKATDTWPLWLDYFLCLHAGGY